MIGRMSSNRCAFLVALALLAYSPAAAALTYPTWPGCPGSPCIDVTTTQTGSTGCSLDQAMQAIRGRASVGGCTYKNGANTIRLYAATFSESNSFEVDNGTNIVGLGPSSTIIVIGNSGYISSAGTDTNSLLEGVTIKPYTPLPTGYPYTWLCLVTDGGILDNVTVQGCNRGGSTSPPAATSRSGTIRQSRTTPAPTRVPESWSRAAISRGLPSRCNRPQSTPTHPAVPLVADWRWMHLEDLDGDHHREHLLEQHVWRRLRWRVGSR